MAQPRVPGAGGDGTLELPCGETVSIEALDLGMREYQCACGSAHAVVMDPHPLSRFFPTEFVEVLQDTITPSADDEFEAFETVHLMGVVMDDFPEMVVAYDAAEDGSVGYAMVWVTDFDTRRLHEVVVELVLELMEHAVSHADDEEAIAAFEEELLSFDVETFVEDYRAARDFEDEFDEPV